MIGHAHRVHIEKLVLVLVVGSEGPYCALGANKKESKVRQNF